MSKLQWYACRCASTVCNMLADQHGWASSKVCTDQLVATKDDVPLQDRTIGHQVITLAGAVPAANYLQLPQDKVDSLALTGQFLYLQVLHYSGMFTWHGWPSLHPHVSFAILLMVHLTCFAGVSEAWGYLCRPC